MQRKTIISFVLSVLAMGVFATAAMAEPVSVTINGTNTYGRINLFEDGTYIGQFKAYEFVAQTDSSDAFTAYCAELGVYIDFWTPFDGEALAMSPEAPWCQIAYILGNYDVTNDFSGNVVQLAIWKLLANGVTLTTDNTAVEDQALLLLQEAEGQCPIMCTGSVEMELSVEKRSDGLGQLNLDVTQNGQPVAGQEVRLSASIPELFSAGNNVMLNGFPMTDENGHLEVVFEIPEGFTSFDVTARVDGQELVYFELGEFVQDLVSLEYGDECSYFATATFEDKIVGYGDPHTIGFWKHQTKANLRGRGRVHVSAETLESWLPISVFDLDVNSLQEMHNALWLKKATMYQRAQQQCLATKLNVAYGELFMNSFVDTDGDGQADSTVSEAFATAEDEYFNGDPEVAKTICDTINNL